MYIKDIFYSFQGEGPFIGYPQIFLRFYGCNIHCEYCDEPDFIHQRKPYTLEKVLDELHPLIQKNPHSISITGGEPLIQVAAIKELLPHIPVPAYLETNGTLPKHLEEVVDLFTYFSVDYKPGFDKEFADFMTILRGRPNVFVKWVLTRGFPVLDLKKMVQTVATVAPDVPFIIQPVTPFGGIKDRATIEDIERAYNFAHQKLADVRVIPQSHKLIGIK
ncbi:7-carboxy-7-deazaguanine synthase QueE [bacterium]|nr:7-carboxy-7-deazaguanine synthase QueE [bacterium]